VLPILTASNSLFFALGETTWEARVILVILFTGSIFSWSVMITKFLQVSEAKKTGRLFHKSYRESGGVLGLYELRKKFDGTPLFHIYQAGCRELIFQRGGNNDGSPPKPLTASGMSAIRSAMEREVCARALGLENNMVMLAIAVSGAPFLGLLGTVWGVMETFSAVAQAGAADLRAMAPGVSAALLTTVVGLLVAIPSMFGYNYLVATIRQLTVEMDNFAAELAAAIEHQFLSNTR
jgi:biopolymer transport protein TolQ